MIVFKILSARSPSQRSDSWKFDTGTSTWYAPIYDKNRICLPMGPFPLYWYDTAYTAVQARRLRHVYSQSSMFSSLHFCPDFRFSGITKTTQKQRYSGSSMAKRMKRMKDNTFCICMQPRPGNYYSYHIQHLSFSGVVARVSHVHSTHASFIHSVRSSFVAK